MKIPLMEFRRISLKEFFTDIEARRDEYFSILKMEYGYVEERTINEEQGLYFNTVDREKSLFLENSNLCIIECYDELENNEMNSLKNNVYNELDSLKTAIYVKNVIKELRHILQTIDSFKFQDEIEHSKIIITKKLQNFISYVENSFLEESSNINTPKIQWLESTKLLTTLFFDLLNGQKKVTKGARNIKPFIKAKTVDIERLLVANFLDKEGQPLQPETIKTYLNKSKPAGKVREGGRIELGFN